MRSRSSALSPSLSPSFLPCRCPGPGWALCAPAAVFPLTWTIPAVAGVPQASSTAAEGARGEKRTGERLCPQSPR